MSARLSSVGIHHRALGRLGGFGANIWHRGASHRRLNRSRLEIDRAMRPAEIVGPPTPRRDRLALGDRAGDGCVRGGSDAAAKQFFRSNALGCKRHDWSRCWPLSRTARLGSRRLRGGVEWDRQRDRKTLVAHDAIDFAFHIVRKLAGAELGEIDAIPGAEPTNLTFVVRTLRRVAARLIDEAVPNVDVNNPRFVGPAAI